MDTETSGLSPFHGDRVCGIAIGPFNADVTYYLPIRHQPLVPDGYRNLPAENVLSWLRDAAVDPKQTWVNHNIKFDLKILRADGIHFAGPVRDTMVMAHMLDSSRMNYALDALTKDYLGFEHTKANELDQFLDAHKSKTPDGTVTLSYSRVPIKLLGDYAIEDVRSTRMLAQKLRDELQQRALPPHHNFGNYAWGTKELFENEMQLVKVLADMEWNGIQVDRERCAGLAERAEKEIEALNDRMAKLAGFSFSPAAWTQMWKAFESAGGTVQYWSRKEKGKQKEQKFTTNKDESTGRPCWNSIAILNYLKQYRGTNERAYNFVLAYWQSEQRRRILASNLAVFLRESDFSGRLHGQFHQHGTLTGRLSSSDPNCQNFGKVKGTTEQKFIEKFLGTKDDDALNRQIRSLFIAPKGKVLLSEDYSQIEYRVATYLSRDPKFLAMYKENANMDYHEETARLAGIDRDLAKTVNFGTLYSMGAGSLAALLGISKDEARKIFDTIYAARPALRQLLTYAHNEAFKGWIQNPYGRRCAVPGDKIYKGLNYLDQGTVGDMMRHALVRLHACITENNYPVKMMLTVHDEVLYEVDADAVCEVAPRLASVMCECRHIPEPPIICDMEVGANWGQGLMPLDKWTVATGRRLCG